MLLACHVMYVCLLSDGRTISTFYFTERNGFVDFVAVAARNAPILVADIAFSSVVGLAA